MLTEVVLAANGLKRPGTTRAVFECRTCGEEIERRDATAEKLLFSDVLGHAGVPSFEAWRAIGR